MKYFCPIQLVGVFFMGALLSCEKESIEANHPSGPVYFQFEIINYAWGYFHSGWYIDSVGEFDFYRLPDDWIEPDSAGFISRSDLMANLQKADSTIYNTSYFDFQKQIRKIDLVDENKFSKTNYTGAADVGAMDLFCFKWDIGHSKYKRILLAESGVATKYNQNDQAKDLTQWLITEGIKSGYFIWF